MKLYPRALAVFAEQLGDDELVGEYLSEWSS